MQQLLDSVDTHRVKALVLGRFERCTLACGMDSLVEIVGNAGYEEMYLETDYVLVPALGPYHKLRFEQRPFPCDADFRANVDMVLDL